jgi:hypothetical protein
LRSLHIKEQNYQRALIARELWKKRDKWQLNLRSYKTKERGPVRTAIPWSSSIETIHAAACFWSANCDEWVNAFAAIVHTSTTNTSIWDYVDGPIAYYLGEHERELSA